MSDVHLDPRRYQGEYGVDGDFNVVPARWQAVIVAAVCLALAAATVACLAAGAVLVATVTAVTTIFVVFTMASYLYITRIGKFEVWASILADLRLRGDEEVLDLGCGRGALLLAAAKLLPDGRAFGIDLWRADQTGNSPDATRRNAEREGVANRIGLHTGDMTQLPFADNTFDLVISNVAVHNIPSAAGRRAAIDEAVRVLRPGGRLAIADLWATNRHYARPHELAVSDVQRRNLGWRMWWGGPWFPTRLVTATKTPDRNQETIGDNAGDGRPRPG
jgi:SAM-dependent methyltransferase